MAKIIKSMKNLIERGGEKGMRKLALILMAGILGLILVTDSALALSLDGYLGPVKLKLSDWEIVGFSGGPSDGIEDNWGVFKITGIEDLVANTLWYPGKNGEYLGGIFYNMDIAGMTFFDSNGDGILDSTRVDMANTAITGTLDIYLDDSDLAGYTAMNPALGPGARVSLAGYPNFTDSNVYGGTALSTTFVPGILPGITVTNVISAVGLVGSGEGKGYGAVVPGSGPLAGMFDANGFLGGAADIFIQYDLTYPAPYGWTLTSEDPVVGCIVPEPTSLLLLGSGLLGIAALGKRKKRLAS